MTSPDHWERPSPAVAEHIRTAARMLMEAPDAVFDAVDEATLGGADEALTSDPVLVARLRATSRSNMRFWAEHNMLDPGTKVPPNLSPEALGIARDVVRRGLDQTALHTYRTGQNVAWRTWMQVCFGLTQDPDELRELLDVSARSIFAFVDATVAGIEAQIGREREQLTRGTHAERLEVVTLVLEGAPITSQRASTRLAYELERPHAAAIVWSEVPTPDQTALERVAEALAAAAGARRPFTVIASASAIWAWVVASGPLDLEPVSRALAQAPDVRVAIGPVAHGMDGFRRSHLDALATQRLLMGMGPELRVATYDDVQLVALATQDAERAQEFVERTLGELATADAELRETVRVYLTEGMSASRAAKLLYTHRNTVLNRMAKAERLLPAPLEGRTLHVALALEIVRWRAAS